MDKMDSEMRCYDDNTSWRFNNKTKRRCLSPLSGRNSHSPRPYGYDVRGYREPRSSSRGRRRFVDREEMESQSRMYRHYGERSVSRDNMSIHKTTTIFVGNIPYDFREEDIRDIFRRFGKIISITIPSDYELKHNKGICFVKYASRKDAKEALNEMYMTKIEGRLLRLDWDVGINTKRRTYEDFRTYRHPDRHHMKRFDDRYRY